MGDFRGSAQDPITNPTDTNVVVWKSDGAGGFDDFQISYSNWAKLLQAEIDAISTIGDQGTFKASDQVGTTITLTHTRGVAFVIVRAWDSSGNEIDLTGNVDNKGGSTTEIDIDFHTDITPLGTCNYRIL